MPKDRDQLTPDEPGDADKLRPRRSAAREAEGDLDASTGPGPGSSGADPAGRDEAAGADKGNYK